MASFDFFLAYTNLTGAALHSRVKCLIWHMFTLCKYCVHLRTFARIFQANLATHSSRAPRFPQNASPMTNVWRDCHSAPASSQPPLQKGAASPKCRVPATSILQKRKNTPTRFQEKNRKPCVTPPLIVLRVQHYWTAPPAAGGATLFGPIFACFIDFSLILGGATLLDARFIRRGVQHYLGPQYYWTRNTIWGGLNLPLILRPKQVRAVHVFTRL